MLEILNQLWVITWKNFLMRKRSYLVTLSEILLPIVLCLFLLQIRRYVPSKPSTLSRRSIMESVKVNDHFLVNGLSVGDVLLLYSPNNPFISELVDNVAAKIQIKHIDRTKGFESEAHLMDYLNKFQVNGTIAKVVALNFDPSVTNTTKRLKYSIGVISKETKWRTDLLFNDYLRSTMENRAERYDTYGFLGVQLAVDTTFIDYQTKTLSTPSTYQLNVNKMMTPEISEKAVMIIMFQYALPFFLIFCFIQLPAVLTKSIVEERSSGFKELLMLMGMKNWVIYFGWFLNAFIVSLVTIAVVLFTFKHPVHIEGRDGDIGIEKIIEHTGCSVFLAFLTLYVVCLICYCFVMSSIFQRPTMASVISTFVSAGTCIMPNYLYIFFPNSWMQRGFETIVMFELRGEGISWNNLFTLPVEGDGQHSLGDIFIYFVLLSVLYCILTWYFNNTYPGKYGIRKSICFPFLDLLNWFKTSINYKNKLSDQDVIDSTNIVTIDAANVEVSDMKVGIEVQNLVKIFDKKVVLNHFSLKIFKNQITALLGPNGAGKTTLMSIMTGLISANNGAVLINGLNVVTHLSYVRKSLGLCPQHDLHLSTLTVREHLMFFSMLKGFSYGEAKRDVAHFLDVLQLESNTDLFPNKLSGGTRRKLSLAISLVGGSQYLVLDEPTTGLDPKSRRQIWDILLQMRGSRTILITTHFMEEADVLGDRIVIINNGELQCYGSTMFLKKRFGTGYELSVISKNCPEELIRNQVEMLVPNSTLKSYNNGVLLFNLPTEHSSKFAQLCTVLEANKTNWQIDGFGLSLTTLEDVFLKVTRGTLELIDSQDGGGGCRFVDNAYDSKNTSVESLNKRKLRGIRLLLQQYNALFTKKLAYMKRNPISTGLQILVPLFFLTLTLNFGKKSQPIVLEEPLDIHLNIYKNSLLYYKNENQDISDSSLSAIYKQVANVDGTKVTDDLVNKIFNESAIDFNNFMSRIIIANEFSENQTFATFYNDFALHSAPIAVNVLTNVVLKTLTKDNSLSITVTNKPLPSDIFSEDVVKLSEITTTVHWLTLFPMGVMLLYTMFMLLPHAERASEIKRIHYVSGVSKLTYWLSHYLYDLFVFFIVVLIMCIIIQIFDTFHIVNHFPELGIFVLIMMTFGAAGILITYICSFFNKSVASSFAMLFVASTIFVILGLIQLVVRENLKLRSIPFYMDAFYCVTQLSPFTPFMMAIFKLIQASVKHQKWRSISDSTKDSMCNDFYSISACCDENSEECRNENDYILGEAKIWKPLVAMVVDIVIYVVILVILETKLFEKLNEYLRSKFDDVVEYGASDKDVQDEADMVKRDVDHLMNTGYTNSNLLVRGFKKIYRGLIRSKTEAVKELNFRVQSGECFGLLGTNGAGKSTTFRMLTGDELRTKGNAFVENFSLEQNSASYLSRIGYCPQSNPLYDFYSGREMITYFAKIRGIRNEDVNCEVQKWIERLDLTSISNRKCINYSGGNKRRLCAAIAMISDPAFVLLDEPTSGVDPSGRRHFWTILAGVKQHGQSILLSSHSMDECEVLCNRLSIMNKGEMVCLGNIKHLKQKFCQGYNVLIKLFPKTEPNNVIEIKQAFCALFVAQLKDEHQTMLHYVLLNIDVLWSEIFKNMEYIKGEFKEFVEDYTVSETTLEQVFLSFSN